MLGKDYDFRLDEKEELRQIIREITGMIALREHLQYSDDADDYILCHIKRGMILDPGLSLSENGIRSGEDLCLI